MTRPYQPPRGNTFDYGQVIKDNLSLVWRHKFLWFFGLFAGTASALGGWSCDYNSYITVPGQSDSDSAREIADSLVAWIQDHLALIVAIMVAGFIIAALLWLWSVFCHGAVVASVSDIYHGKAVDFRGAARHGQRNFRKLLRYMLLASLIPLLTALALSAIVALIYFLLTALGEPGAIAGTILLFIVGAAVAATVLSTLGLFAAFGLWPVAAIAFFLIFNLGSRSVVLADARPVAALKHGGRLLFENITRASMLFIISVGISIGATIVMVFAGLMSAIPAAAAWIFTYNAGMPVGGIIVASLLSLPPLIVGLVFVAALNTYFAAFWTDSWMLFTGDKQQVRPAGKQGGKRSAGSRS